MQRFIRAVMAISLIFLCSRIDSLHEADRIIRLPGQPPVSFQQFSGYITVDEKQRRSLFYYFVEAETSPASKPLVLWLNGGPGCSSVGAGAFVEHGPFRPTTGNSLVRNEYSWNKEANMLYLESPAGVGFSYSVNQTFYSSVNDAMTARDNLVFLRRWFIKFPQYKQRDFFIAGESYAGHYVPQLARLIIRSKVNFNLKGIAIGNPLLEFNTDLNARDHFYWSHGLISDSTYQLLTSVCNNSKLIREAIARSVSTACFGVYTLVQQEVSDSIDPYDVTGDVCLSSNHSQLKIFNQQLVRPRLPNLSPQVLEVDSIKQQKQVMGKVDVCLEEETTKYLNRKDVQMALHARLVGVTNWHVCSVVLDYDISDEEIPTIHAVRSLVKSGLAVLVYSGDQDSVIPFTGTRSLVSKVAQDLRLETTVPYRAWLSGNQGGNLVPEYSSIGGRLVDGHKFTVITYLSPPLEELLTQLHQHSPRDLCSCSRLF
ncbi:SERINE PROTEASE FAMILY S10 SERINE CARBOXYPEPTIDASE [Salix koriyanagi]|uniref:Carboxypeptidase n=1 Tax=Salix koriyanagi TaxID=2511006 RepID=A0A9Q0ZUX7_9ROSI|nr:SERINE PROTEASE FAMILY S10 SERINE CARBOXYPEPTIDASE [Salix koriyanagi]